MLSYSLDPKNGVLTVVVEGRWTADAVARYRSEGAPIFEDARRRTGRLRLLVDNTRCELLAKELVPAIVDAGLFLHRPTDRIASVVDSSLFKLQLKRILPEEVGSVFISRDAAITWLLAHDVELAPHG